MSLPPQGSVVRRRVHRLSAAAPTPDPAGGDADDTIAVEEPLELRVDGETVAVTMRTPGDDRHLALGFLYAEGIIASVDDVGTVAHCGRPGDEGYGNVIDVRSAPGTPLDIDRVLEAHRWSMTSAACGVCGRHTIDGLVKRAGRVTAATAISADTLARAVEHLRELQPTFARTGGLHAAAAFTGDGRLLACHEDVGRHNAVDKTVGDLLYKRLVGPHASDPPPSERPTFLVVSGRSSFEIVQKAAVARIPIVASVSAASSLAIDLADATGITLAAFVRGASLNLYTHPERITARAST